MIIYSNYGKRPVSSPEKGGGKILVETAGYVSTEKRIKDFLNAGILPPSANASMFDIAPGSDIDDAPIDPTRAKGFDRADLSQMRNDLQPRAKKALVEHRKALSRASVLPSKGGQTGGDKAEVQSSV